MTQSTGSDDGTFPLTHWKTGSIKRLIMVTSDLEPKQIDSGVKEPDEDLNGYAPAFPINKSLIQLTQLCNILLSTAPEFPQNKKVRLGPKGSRGIGTNEKIMGH